MDVFLGNLPAEATLVDLHGFVGDFELRADIRCCRGRDALDRTYHYFIVHAGTRKAGLELMERLNGRDFFGQAVVAREFIRRKPVAPWSDLERRINPW